MTEDARESLVDIAKDADPIMTDAGEAEADPKANATPSQGWMSQAAANAMHAGGADGVG